MRRFSDVRTSPRLALTAPLVVIDTETTGFYVSTDRIVEIAILRLAPDGTVEDEYCTLVNPLRDVGPTEIHGITASDVVDAPRFEDIVGDVLQRLGGAVVVGHNVKFDLRFLTRQVARAGYELPDIPTLCTLAMSHRLEPDLPQHRLGVCCEHAGIELRPNHDALGDAAATAQLVMHYLRLARARGLEDDLRELDDVSRAPVEVSWPTCAPSGRSLRRRDPGERSRRDGRYITRLLERVEEPRMIQASVAAYLDVLARVLEDRLVTEMESDALYDVARIWRLTGDDMRNAHRGYVRGIVDAALADGVVSDAERKDLNHVAALLSVTEPELEGMLAEAEATHRDALRAGEAVRMRVHESLVGQSVCFTGSLVTQLHGKRITRNTAEDLAKGAGLTVRDSVCSGLGILVVADPHTQSTKARRARESGVRVLAEVEFWRMLGVQTD